MTDKANAWFVIVKHGDKELPQIYYGDRPTAKRTDSPPRRFIGNPVQIDAVHIMDHHMDLKALNEIYRPKVLAA